MTDFAVSLPPELVEAIAQRAAELVLERHADAEPASRWLSIAEAADYLRCSKQHVYDLRSSRRIGNYGTGRHALIDRHELDRLVMEGGM